MLTSSALALSLLGAAASQSPAKLTFLPSVSDPDMVGLLRFENIEVYKLKFEGESLTGKSYELRIKRFEKGKLVLNQLSMDSAELGPLGEVSKGNLTFSVYSKADGNRAKIAFQFDRFGTDRKLDCTPSKFDYVMKNFLGAENTMPIPVGKETYILAYLLPHEKPDGSSSYCEVAQSGLDPEKLWDAYKVPCYFLVSIKFK
jgi:hypothetical protein